MKKLLLLILLLNITCFGQIDAARQIINTQALDTRQYSFRLVNGSGVSGTLTSAGAGKTLTFTQCPKGLSGTNTNHYVYIALGTGTAEAVLVTGGTCVGGALAGGTIIVTTANTHSGAWIVRSASVGIQEAIWAGGVTSKISLPAGSFGFDAKVTIPGNYCTSIHGQGDQQSIIVSNFTAGDVLVYESGTCGYVDFGDIAFTQVGGTDTHTSGAFLKVRYRTDGNVTNVLMNHCYNCLMIERSQRNIYSNLNLNGVNIGLLITCQGVTIGSGCQNQAQFTGIKTGMNAGGTGVYIEDTITGLIFSNLFTENGLYSVLITAQAAVGPPNEIIFGDTILDGATGAGLIVIGNNSTFNNNSIQISNSRITTTSTGVGVQLSSKIQGVKIVNSHITASGNPNNGAIRLGDVQNISITGNKISSPSNAALVVDGPVSNLFIAGNVIGYNPDTGSTTGASTTAITLGGANSNVVISNNNLYGSTNVINSSSTGSIFTYNNVGLDSSPITMASSSTLALATGNAGFSNTINLTGTTSITTITGGFAGRTIIFGKTDSGSIAFNTGGTSPNDVLATATLAQNQILVCVRQSSGWLCANPSSASTLAGDVTGASGANTVTKLQNNAVQSGTPTDGQQPIYDTANTRYSLGYVANGPLINALNYGADPTNTSDSSTAINNAIIAAGSTKSCVFLPAGTYKLTASGVNLGNGTATTASTIEAPCLVGAGRERTIIKASASYCPATISISTTNNGNPDLLSTGSAHGLYVGQLIGITGSTGDTAINGLNWQIITVPSTTTFTIGATTTGLTPVVGNGAYTGSGVITNKFPNTCAVLQVKGPHNNAYVADLSLDANSVIRDGLDIGHAANSKFARINIRNYTDKAIYASSVTTYWSGGAIPPGHAGNNSVLYGNCLIGMNDITANGPIGSGASMLWIDGLNDPAAPAGFDTCSSVFTNINGNPGYSGGAGTYGLMTRAADSNIFNFVGASNNSSTGGFDYYWSQPSSGSGFPANNFYQHALTFDNGFGGSSGANGFNTPTTQLTYANEACNTVNVRCFPHNVPYVSGISYAGITSCTPVTAGSGTCATFYSPIADSQIQAAGRSPKIGLSENGSWGSADMRARFVMSTVNGDYSLNARDAGLSTVVGALGGAAGNMWLGSNDLAHGPTIAGTTFSGLGSSKPNGTIVYCSDCTKATPCAGSGSGSFAKRINSAWDCN